MDYVIQWHETNKCEAVYSEDTPIEWLPKEEHGYSNVETAVFAARKILRLGRDYFGAVRVNELKLDPNRFHFERVRWCEIHDQETPPDWIKD